MVEDVVDPPVVELLPLQVGQGEGAVEGGGLHHQVLGRGLVLADVLLSGRVDNAGLQQQYEKG